jgi:hypothetical protein
MENILPCCISILFKPDSDFNDAQQILVSISSIKFGIDLRFFCKVFSLFNKVLNEIIKCLNLLYVKFGEEFIQYLEQRYVNTLQISPRAFEVRNHLSVTLWGGSLKFPFEEYHSTGKNE